MCSSDLVLDAELEELMHWEMAPQNPARLDRAGVPFVLTSQGLSDPAELIPQIRKAIQRGLDPIRALEALTTKPADLLGVADQVGRIRPGYWANFIVANGNLFDEKTRIEEVWVRGNRPAAAYKEDRDIDGLWDIALVDPRTPNTLANLMPSKLQLAIKDSTKKISGSILLPAPPEAPQPPQPPPAAPSTEAAPQPDPKSPEANAQADAPKADPPAETLAQEPAPANPPANSDAQKGDAAKSDKTDNAEKKDSEPKEQKKETNREIKLQSVRWSDSTLNASLPSKLLGQSSGGENAQADSISGTALLSGALIGNDPASTVLIGSIRLPDGSEAVFRATRSSEQVPAPERRRDGGEGPRGGGRGRGPNAASNNTDDNANAAGDNKGKSSKEDSNKVWSGLRYPFASFGRESLPEQPEVLVIQNTTLWTSGPAGTLRDADMKIGRAHV